ncbi:hypothetical protein SAICODRAFT_6408 [Saitoella complicata NRRL Y-17804]|uniref:uncharacterized protein n=1 Tax=Saitoella complicata (strain BCRC 22490 / CBS 7301 / JCM 7358 / NBRC 10748 / NRRL Y-17804) TaxID=698492 RepID=UPI000866AFA9|nr:uncharacterized protein SAICODRAFT_6408 [Saitoella complicata NRRL Y-17804]ODQ54113.1 hypothetical protein SAICODRAFT_6408 [Saitoella complicata NRRL Y-17804]
MFSVSRIRIASSATRLGFQARFLQSKKYPQIYLHSAEAAVATDKPMMSVSFLSKPPMHPDNTLGWAPLDSKIQDIDLSPVSKFQENPSFLPRFQSHIRTHLPQDPITLATASSNGDGWIHIADERNPPPYGRIPYPEDIVGTVRVEGGEVKVTTYESGDQAYRVVSANGPPKLAKWLHGKVVEEMEKLEGEMGVGKQLK